jgi:D-alanyl-D-alanine dipeptidase
MSNAYAPYLQIGKMEVKNRIVMSPMGLNAAHPDGRIDDDEIHYFEERARGGTGLIIMGCQFLTEKLAQGSLEGYLDNTHVIPQLTNLCEAVVDGYEAPKAVLTEEAAQALKKAADTLYEQGFYIKIFDAYRPQSAVNHFIRWAKDLDDIKMKEEYYPDLDKSVLFELGYIAEKSGHSRGSTVDLTLVEISTGKELDMGSGFDFFGEISNHGTDLITEEQEKNRNILRDAMVDAGFEVYPEEWWHYKLMDEPYPDTYFDFPVK